MFVVQQSSPMVQPISLDQCAYPQVCSALLSYVNWTAQFFVVVKRSADLLNMSHSRKSENHSTPLPLAYAMKQVEGYFIVPEERVRNVCEIHCYQFYSTPDLTLCLGQLLISLFVLAHSESHSLSGPTLNMARFDCAESLLVL